MMSRELGIEDKLIVSKLLMFQNDSESFDPGEVGLFQWPQHNMIQDEGVVDVLGVLRGR